VKYQQGKLMGYKVKEYLLEKWGRHYSTRYFYIDGKFSPPEK